MREVAKRSRGVAAVVLSLIIVASAWTFPRPGTAQRAAEHDRYSRHHQLLAHLRREGVDAVIGPYWTVYSLNFDSDEEIAAVTCHPAYDFWQRERLVDDDARWAFIDTPTQPWISRLERVVSPEGSTDTLAGYRVFIPDPSEETPADLMIERARTFCGALA